MAGALVNFPILSPEQAAPYGPQLAQGFNLAQQGMALPYQVPTLQAQLANLQAQARTAQAQAQYAPQMAQAELAFKQAQAQNPILSTPMGQLLYMQGLLSGGQLPGAMNPVATQQMQQPSSQLPAQQFSPAAQQFANVTPEQLAALAKFPGVKLTSGEVEPAQVTGTLPISEEQKQKNLQLAAQAGVSAPALASQGGGEFGQYLQRQLEQFQPPSIFERLQNQIATGTPLTPAQAEAMKITGNIEQLKAQENIKNFNEKMTQAKAAAEGSTKLRNLMTQWSNLAEASSFTGPVGGLVSTEEGVKGAAGYLISKALKKESDFDVAQTMDQIKEQMVDTIAYGRKTGATTNEQLNFAKGLKPSRSLTPAARERVVNFSEAMAKQLEEYPQFFSTYVGSGYSPAQAEKEWNSYITDHPTFDVKTGKEIPENIYGWRERFGLPLPEVARQSMAQKRKDNRPVSEYSTEELLAIVRGG